MTKPVHIHKSSLYKNTNILLLLIPAIIFVLVLAFYLLSFRASKPKYIATTNEPSVLGQESQLDNSRNESLK